MGPATVTISGTAPPGFNATEVDVHSNTAGVTVAPPSRSFPPGPFTGTWILTGAAPGQSVDLQVTGVDSGAGTNGADKCCTSDITVVIPPQHREPPTDLGIQKTSVVRADGAYVMGYTYTLSVTNVGAPVNGQNAVTVTDVVPNGLAFTRRHRHGLELYGTVPHRGGRHADLHLYRQRNAGDRTGPAADHGG